MGFFFTGKKAKQSSLTGISVDLLHRKQCEVCTLNHIGNRTPYMQPSGSDYPVVYMIGEAPGRNEDQRGEPFVGDAGKALRLRIPNDWSHDIRFSNVVRCRPPENRTPTPLEIECCRPSVEADIAATKPQAIFGFGGVPLYWAARLSGITNWAGRRIPVVIGGHACWFFPMLHPSYVIRSRKFAVNSAKEYGSDIEFSFALDMKRAFAAVQAGLPDPVIHTPEQALANIECVTGAEHGDLRAVENFLSHCAEPETKLVGFDYETNTLRPYKAGAKLLSIAISTPDRTMAIALDHPGAGWQGGEIDEVFALLSQFFHEAPCRKTAHNLPFELEWTIHTFGVSTARAQPYGDSLAQAYVLNGGGGALALNDVCLRYFGLNLKAIENTDRKNLEKTPIEVVLRYNALDARYHRLAYLEQMRELKREQLTQAYRHIVGRAATMALTQRKGVPLNFDAALELAAKYETLQADKLEIVMANPAIAKFEARYQKPFNPGSNPDTLNIFRNVLGIPIASADATALEGAKDPLANALLAWRAPGKVLSTYIRPSLPDSPDVYPDGLLHPVINPIGTRTTRTSSDHPNIQNWPKRKLPEIRNMVEAGAGCKIYAFDYAGIQARNVAMESRDKALTDAFWHNYDIHSAWMARIVALHPKWATGLDNPKVVKEYRNRAKNELVFPAFFGAQPKAVAGYLEVPEHVAEKLLDEFWDQFPDIKAWHERLFKLYKSEGYVTGLSGFRRLAPISPNEIINTPIQADEAFIVCSAMERLSKLDPDMLQANMEIHDDLTFIWPEDVADRYISVVAQEMTRPAFPWITTPLVVELSVGRKWGALEEVEKFSSEQIWEHRRDA